MKVGSCSDYLIVINFNYVISNDQIKDTLDGRKETSHY